MEGKPMTDAYYIQGWHERYEVTADDREAKPEKDSRKLRAGPLRYIRYPVSGHTMPIEDKRMQEAARTPAQYEAALCLWPKLLALAGAQKREYRGWLLTERQEPATVQDLALFTGIRPKTIKIGLELFAHPDVQLIELRPFQPGSAENCENPQNAANPLTTDTDTETETDTEIDTETNTTTTTETDTPDGQNNAQKNTILHDSQQGTPRQGAACRSSSPCLSPKAFAQSLAVSLDLSPRNRQQLNADQACFRSFAEHHLVSRHLGDPKTAADRCYRKAEEIAKDPEVLPENQAKVWVSWAKKILGQKGHQWGDEG